MTDKVQKILSEIATRKLCTMDEHMAFYNDTAKEDYRFLSEIEKLIKALQEEPVSTKDKLLALSDGKLHLGWIDDAKVVEFEDCLMQFHEDMNNIPQSTDSLTQLKDTDGVLHSYSKKLMSMAKEEPVSEELEVELKNYLNSDEYINTLGVSGYLLVARHFANWQKQQDQSTIELAEDHAMLAGMNIMEQQMMEKAIDAHCFGFQGSALFSFELPADKYLVGSKVKVIVIKKD